MIVESWVVFSIGYAAVTVLAIAGYWCVARLASRRWRRPWLAVAVIVVGGLGIVSLIDDSLEAPRALERLDASPGLPATYTAEGSSFTLSEDGSAVLTNVVLADAVTRNDAGRWCLSGESESVSGDARWTMTRDGRIRIDVRDKVSQLFPDPRPLLGYGWVRGYLLTSCDVPLASEYWASQRR
ncbi:hypothetical protein OVN18_04380 [Microcella daejeonensis]|uniref:Uncharacterized protein n=1 Tax=Microcella daejeonensis TaxID=2994971 RepID=A0A9E8SC61_9MICO|nr:hypothetical protein [Microcella daejeonensis]WAB82252.1 hypothetical protein OVN18_04380 [Microcella daejeonensis]